MYYALERLLIKSCKSQELESDLETICQFYKEDFDQDFLRTQLQTFAVHFQQVHVGSADSTTKNVNIYDVKSYLLSLSPAQLSLISKVKHLMQLILVMPATNASSERSFSALRRVKSYLHATHEAGSYMLVHVHKDKTDELDLKLLVNEYINSDHRSNIFLKWNSLFLRYLPYNL